MPLKKVLGVHLRASLQGPYSYLFTQAETLNIGDTNVFIAKQSGSNKSDHQISKGPRK